jgi:hypothetical protein
MASTWETPARAVRSMRKDGAVWSAIRRDLGNWKTFVAVILAAALLAAIPAIIGFLSGGLPGLVAMLERFNPAVSALSGALMASAGAVAWITRKAVIAKDAVAAAVAAYQKAVIQPNESQTSLAEEKEAVSAAAVKVDEARAALHEAVARQASAANAFTSETPGERLRAFVQSRAAVDGPYRSREGLIANIRRDFADLSALLEGQNTQSAREASDRLEAYVRAVDELKARHGADLTPDELKLLEAPAMPSTAEARFERIVLYIDDLDRCPDQTVIDVLQAVHLLMAFPLFVVVVAVDVRWLKTALLSRHAQLEDAADAREGAGVHEYLEKIFQLVAWTEPLAADDVGDFLRGRLGGETSRKSRRRGGRRGGRASEAAQQPRAAGLGQQLATRLVEERRDPADANHAQAPLSAAALRISDMEIEMMERICRILEMTPRRLARFANSYQVARASLNRSEATHLGETGYPALIAFLSVTIALPDRACAVADALDAASDWPGFARQLSGHDEEVDPMIGVWRYALEIVGLTPMDLSRYRALVLRLSFLGDN